MPNLLYSMSDMDTFNVLIFLFLTILCKYTGKLFSHKIEGNFGISDHGLCTNTPVLFFDDFNRFRLSVDVQNAKV
jgi:hypothetical protein